MADIPYTPLDGERPELSITLHDGTEEQVSIVVIHKDRPEYLNICLQSIAVTSLNNNYEIIVVDNSEGDDRHSLEETTSYLDSLKQDGIKVIQNKKNAFWAPAVNQGVAKADKQSKYYLFLHCDTVIINPAWIDLLINVSEAQNSGMVGVDLQSYFMNNQKIDFIQEHCLLMSKECWDDIGPFPEAVPQIGPSFVMTIKAQTAGWKPQVIRTPVCHHYRIFALDISEFERLSERAMVELPKLIRDAQQVAKRV
jgi:glycosyltransferase involved in cell wall biosynthesis